MVSEEFTSDREPLRKLKHGQAVRSEKQSALLRQYNLCTQNYTASNIFTWPQTSGGVTLLFFWTDVANLEPCKALALSKPFSGLEDRVCILQYELLYSVYATDTPKMWSVTYHRLFSPWLILEQSEDTNLMQNVMHSTTESCCSALVSRWGHSHRTARTWKTAFRVSFI